MTLQTTVKHVPSTTTATCVGGNVESYLTNAFVKSHHRDLQGKTERCPPMNDVVLV